MARAPDKRIEQAKEMYLQGRKLVEIASQLNLPEGTVRRPGLQYPIIVPQTQYLCVFRALYRGKRRTGIMIR